MNVRAMLRYISITLKMEILFMIAPLGISIYDGSQGAVKGFAASIIIILISSAAMDFCNGMARKKENGGKARRNRGMFFFRESFALVALCWVSLSLFWALPFWISGEIPSFLDAVFESVSGLTTTSATILTDIEGLPRGFLFWRCFSNWIGGMGVLVFLLAMLPLMAGESTLDLFKAESPGPVPGKLVPKLQRSAGILYGIYFAMTVAALAFFAAGGMPAFDSVCTAMSTAGTGGFPIKNESLGAYNSLYIEVAATVFMTLFGVNFNIYFFILTGSFKDIWKNEELKAYLWTIAASVIIITWDLAGHYGQGAGQALRLASFSTVSVITTTGFSTTDFNLWPQLSKAVLFFLTLSGACAGSTSGGLKISRLLILLKEARRRLYHISHPHSVDVVRLDGKVVERHIVHAVTTYCILYCFIVFCSLLIVSLDNFDFETTITSVFTCVSNVGLGFGMISPAGNFSGFSVPSKLTLIFDMLLGRLEIYPILLLFTPHAWKRL